MLFHLNSCLFLTHFLHNKNTLPQDVHNVAGTKVTFRAIHWPGTSYLAVMSIVDRLVKGVTCSAKCFGDGWGDQRVLNELTQLSVTMKNPKSCMQPVAKYFDSTKMNCVEDKKGNKHFRTFTGSFESPLNCLFPDLLPLESRTCNFKMILPKEWKNEDKKRICLHYAPTGDHGYTRRGYSLAHPIAKDYNIGSVLVENPYYGSRKPEKQSRSAVGHVTDIFSMGCSLMLEGQFIFSWLEYQGYGPLGISGVSLGGHNASLTAAVWQKPIAVIPCLSWSSAAHTFSESILKSQCTWDVLQAQLQTDKLQDIHHAINKSQAEIEVLLAERSLMKQTEENRIKTESKINNMKVQSVLDALRNSDFTNSVGNRLPSYITNSFGDRTVKKQDVDQELAELYMRLLFDTFTNLRFYPRPVTASLNSTVVIIAKDDLYIPQPVDDDILDISEVWPGCDIKTVEGGHISTYVTQQKIFREAIKLAFDKLDVELEKEKLILYASLEEPSGNLNEGPHEEQLVTVITTVECPKETPGGLPKFSDMEEELGASEKVKP